MNLPASMAVSSTFCSALKRISSMRRLAAGVNTEGEPGQADREQQREGADRHEQCEPSPTPHADNAAISPSRLSRASASVTPRNSVIGISKRQIAQRREAEDREHRLAR